MPNPHVVNPPKAVRVLHGLGGNSAPGLLVEWRQRDLLRAGKYIPAWEGLIVWVSMIRGDGRDEWSVRVGLDGSEQVRRGIESAPPKRQNAPARPKS